MVVNIKVILEALFRQNLEEIATSTIQAFNGSLEIQ